ncbi:MAG: addiction module protein [Trichlorobacter sp.]|uniref:addiction module protein n=1 Tax=Trichlorobacter sp. TaxID=2911007 RepID=UPI0025600FA0|nr:addiction module protein [Trichlorobacter sp.]MDK9718750.1 addiction module protein [Trichlorobacter sp.]
MIQRTDPIVRQLAELPDADRLQLVDYLLESLDQPDPEIERLWVAEAQSRWDAYQRGEISSVPENEVFAKYRT